MVELRFLADVEIVAEERGKEIGRRELLLRLLERRLGRLNKADRLALTELPLRRLPALGEALFDFQSAADFRAWLAEHSKNEG